MKKFKAFTLTEILTGMMLQAGFVIVLMGAFYMLVNFQSANTKLITAREKGQRVLAYIENRVIHAGLGLWKCGSPSEIRESFGIGNTLKTNAFNKLTLPVAVTNDDKNDGSNWKATNSVTPPSDGIYRGNVLTVLYAIPEISSVYLGPKIPSTRVFILDNGSASKDVIALSADQELGCDFIYNNNDNYTAKGFEHQNPNPVGNLKSWAVTHSSGYPLYLSYINSSTKKIDGKNYHILLSAKHDVNIASGSELLYIKCEKMYITTVNSERVFTRINLDEYDNWSSAGKSTANKSYEDGILEVYFELDTNTNILDCYVLSSGGKDFSLSTQRPDSWPASANWNDNEYKYHNIYVSRTSWKLHNINWSSASWANY